MYTLGRSGRRSSINIWPGFVDGLATLLLVVIFVLMVFIVAQYFLSIALTGKDERLAELDQQIAELADLLALERSANAELRINVTQLSSELQSSLAARDDLSGQLAGLGAARDELADQVRSLSAARDELTAQLAALAAERETLSDRLASTTANRDELAQQLAALTIARNDLDARLAALRDVRDELSARLQGLEAEKQALSADLDSSEEERNRLEREVATLMALRDRLRADLATETAGHEALAERLGSSEEERDRLLKEVTALQLLRDRLSEDLAAATAARAAGDEALAEEKRRSAGLDAQLADAFTTIEADREKIETQLVELAILKDLRQQLERQLAELERRQTAAMSEATDRDAELDSLREDRDDLRARLTQSDESLSDLRSRLSQTQDYAMEQQQLSDEAQRKVDLLNRQLLALRQQIATLNAALEAAELLNEEQQVQIVDLGKRLNVALASKVQELARYRSEFFGRLRQVLGNNPNIRIVGDRFVFQAEVLFPSGSAELEPAGREQIGRLAETLRAISQDIPDDIDWVLRVDGHTDVRPIRTAQFPSNWELSSARAIAVVKFLISQGLPANRLVAAGFGQFQPIDTGNDEIAFRRNRRIEFKLTER